MAAKSIEMTAVAVPTATTKSSAAPRASAVGGNAGTVGKQPPPTRVRTRGDTKSVTSKLPDVDPKPF
jgi:hypothetical protein